MDRTTATLRGFNRTWTQRVGALDESYLGTGRPLATSRLLFELDPVAPTPVTDLRDWLGLDAGYLARLLRRLEAEGLATTVPDPEDRRRRQVGLTDAGRDERAELERRSAEAATRLLRPLTDRQRERLADALAVADLLVRAATLDLRRARPDEPAVARALTRYVAELADRFPAGFDPGPADPRDPGTTYLLATSDGEPVACGGVRPLEAGTTGTAEVKRMWVDAAWRGAGLGARLLASLEDLARDLGHTRVVLDTNSTLVEAVALYDRAGYRRIDRYNDNPYAEAFFTKGL
ncbi:helix-turn-helix domain-containing GNAT family N-acetyltransferase [uncultured Nocardioides sp.]|uniref:bifunctional helix-turn-helix transcriptional regulator/GNAT family N-acetyltransferase n=1 Tax=uncultured Nocardioides sp. TaxID=198441 RepID=UPI00260ECD22|nr:helix-turn-helix domain-containing GNAT family N-acetyltransferase [uncultured Nocardioides sp.]